jgi:hypothetical protein
MDNERLFNFRLYHLVYHWAAYIATLVLMLSLGALVALTPSLTNPYAVWYLSFANIAGACASWFFLVRMKTYGDQLHSLMGGAGKASQWYLKHPFNLLLGAVVTLIILVFNLIVICSTAGLSQNNQMPQTKAEDMEHH